MTDRKPPYAIRYQYNGRTYNCTIWAESWEDAERRLRSIGATGEVYGSDVQSFSANPVTLPFSVLWVRFICWWRNLGRGR